MKQAGNEVEVTVKEDGDRRIFYVDVGDMTPKEALRVINEIRAKQGQGQLSRSWVNWVYAGIAILAFTWTIILVAPFMALL